MGRSVSYPSAAQVVTFANWEPEFSDTGFEDYDELIDAFRQHLKTLFPSVEEADEWIGQEDHVLAENKLARFGMSEYCGLVAYWIVPKKRHSRSITRAMGPQRIRQVCRCLR